MKKLLRGIAAALLVPLLLFEEWGWEPLAAAMARLARLPIWARLESMVQALPPQGALLVFLLPVLTLLPFKLLALFLLGAGHAKSAVLLLISAKLVGTAIVARLFQLVEPALMRIPLFARWYPRWMQWKDRVLTWVRQSAPWRGARYLKSGARRWWRSLRRA
ncbi:MAG: hypothetical protein EOP82_24895 [Variovorax sp.]|nr:MAG: hypothetical protein EOP82_24895 [Variovorax sp.]